MVKPLEEENFKRKNGGGRWIRTIEVSDSRFTVCPLWPLGNPTTTLERVKGIEPSQSAWKADVLPLNYTCVPRTGIEPVTRGFSVLCSTD